MAPAAGPLSCPSLAPRRHPIGDQELVGPSQGQRVPMADRAQLVGRQAVSIQLGDEECADAEDAGAVSFLWRDRPVNNAFTLPVR